MNVVFVGGCHLVGKPHGINHGFVRKLWKKWRKESRDIHFDLVPYAVNWESLSLACQAAISRSPDILIVNIQAGLVLPTWDRTLRRLGMRRKSAQEDPTLNWFAPADWKLESRGKLYWLTKAASIMICGGHIEKWPHIVKIWQELAALFDQSTARVIVLTPTPVHSQYFVRGKAHLERVRKIVLHYRSKYEVCDVYPDLLEKGPQALWIDGQHLSKEGHNIIAEKLWKMVKGE